MRPRKLVAVVGTDTDTLPGLRFALGLGTKFEVVAFDTPTQLRASVRRGKSFDAVVVDCRSGVGPAAQELPLVPSVLLGPKGSLHVLHPTRTWDPVDGPLLARLYDALLTVTAVKRGPKRLLSGWESGHAGV